VHSRRELEAIILSEIKHCQADHKGHEDSFVELKRELPDPPKAARRIAALCNSAHGAEAIWILGVDNKSGTVIGLQSTEIADWWAQVVKHFDEEKPDMVHVVVHADNSLPVIGMFFTTDRAPFVIKIEGGVAQLEVPWREGTLTRSARRHELMRILGPIILQPDVRILELTVSASRNGRIPAFESEHPGLNRPV